MHAAAPRPRSALRALLNNEASGGLVLMGAAVLALVVANSPVSGGYFEALHRDVLGLSVLHWINDALMAVFFLLVGLEIKREMLDGQFSTWPRRAEKRPFMHSRIVFAIYPALILVFLAMGILTIVMSV